MSVTINLTIPEYCDIYKPLTVEEIALNSCPPNLHYGKCSVVGKTIYEDGHIYLGNVRMPNLPKEYALREGQVKVELLTKYYDSHIPEEQTFEIFGEVVFRDKNDTEESQLPKTSKELMLELHKAMSKCEEECTTSYIENEIEKMKLRYLPAIKPHTINLIDKASELLECNLQIRILQKLKKEKNINETVEQ